MRFSGCISPLSGLKELGKSLGELKAAVDDIFNNFIKGFGVLTDYAERRLTQVTGVGRDKILTQLPDSLREAAGVFERYTGEFAKVSDYLLRKHGKSVANRQHDLKRVAPTQADDQIDARMSATRLQVVLAIGNRLAVLAQQVIGHLRKLPSIPLKDPGRLSQAIRQLRQNFVTADPGDLGQAPFGIIGQDAKALDEIMKMSSTAAFSSPSDLPSSLSPTERYTAGEPHWFPRKSSKCGSRG